MNTEELKIIMDALVQLGEAGKAGFIWWLVMEYALYYATIISFIIGVVITVRMVATKLVSITHGNQLGMELSDLLKTSENQYRGWSNESYRASTKAAIINKVRHLIDASNTAK